MAVAIDAITTDKTTSTAGSVTFAHTCTGSDLVLYIACAFDDSNTHTFTDVTYNGVSATAIASTELGTGRSIYLFRLIAPATGANNVVIDWVGNFNTVSYLACSVTGADQATPDTGTGSDEGNGTSISIPSITSTANDFVLGFGYLNNEGIGDVTEGAGQTLEGNDDSTNGVIWCSSKAGAASNQSLSWTVTSQSFGALGVSISPSSSVSVTVDQTECEPGDTITWTEDFTGTVTGAKLIDSNANELDLSSVTDNGDGTGSAVVPAMANQVSTTACLFESGVTLSVTDGTDTATDTIDYDQPTGYSLVTLASLGGAGDDTDWTAQFDTAAAVGDQSIWDDANITHNNDETTTVAGATSYIYYTIDATDGGVSQINKTFAADGSVASTNTGFGIGIATNMGIGL